MSKDLALALILVGGSLFALLAFDLWVIYRTLRAQRLPRFPEPDRPQGDALWL